MRKSAMIDLTLDDGDNINMETEDDEPVEMTEGDVQSVEVTSYNFGNGIDYNPDTHTVSADMIDVVSEDDDRLVTSGAVFDALEGATFNSGTVYAEEEVKIGRFGRRYLYQRMITVNNVMVSNIRTNGIIHGIEDTDDIFVAEAYFRDENLIRSNGAWMNATGGANTLGKDIPFQWLVDDTYIWINSDTFFNANEKRTWRIIVRYTKANE